MSRSRRVLVTSARTQNPAGITGGSNALGRMGLSLECLRPSTDAVGSLPSYITVIYHRVIGSRRTVADVGVMQQQCDSSAVACTACRGRGWKFCRSRRALVIGTLTRGAVEPARRSCPECQGSGHAE